MDDHPKAPELSSGLTGPDMLSQSIEEVGGKSMPAAVPVKLNTELHVHLLRSGKVRPSTLESAMAALERVRRALAG